MTSTRRPDPDPRPRGSLEICSIARAGADAARAGYPLQDVRGTSLPSPDGWIQDVSLALESNSYEFHSSPQDWRRTYERETQLAIYGVQTLHFTPRDVREDPDHVLATIEKVYRERTPGFTRVTAE